MLLTSVETVIFPWHRVKRRLLLRQGANRGWAEDWKRGFQGGSGRGSSPAFAIDVPEAPTLRCNALRRR
jgi:hypothetical protein